MLRISLSAWIQFNFRVCDYFEVSSGCLVLMMIFMISILGIGRAKFWTYFSLLLHLILNDVYHRVPVHF